METGKPSYRIDKFKNDGKKLDYIHENPVRAGVVNEPQYYKYGSAFDYFEDKAGLLEIQRM